MIGGSLGIFAGYYPDAQNSLSHHLDHGHFDGFPDNYFGAMVGIMFGPGYSTR